MCEMWGDSSQHSSETQSWGVSWLSHSETLLFLLVLVMPAQ